MVLLLLMGLWRQLELTALLLGCWPLRAVLCCGAV
jgi:hypothetical protein